MNEVQVLSRTQRIIIDSTASVTIVNAGPPGPPGINGQPGATGGHRYYGEGPPGTIVGATLNDEYVDTLTGDLYILQ